jgi:hypothetical protein
MREHTIDDLQQRAHPDRLGQAVERPGGQQRLTLAAGGVGAQMSSSGSSTR